MVDQNKCIIIQNLKLVLIEKNNQLLLIQDQILWLFLATIVRVVIVEVMKILALRLKIREVLIFKLNVLIKYFTETEEFVNL